MTEIQNVKGVQQEGESPLLAFKVRGGHVARNRGWSQGAESGPMLTTSKELGILLLQLPRIKFCYDHMSFQEEPKLQMTMENG